jgi:hypothetical protein
MAACVSGCGVCKIYFNVNFNILCLIKGEFVGLKRNFDVIKMHGTMIKKFKLFLNVITVFNILNTVNV